MLGVFATSIFVGYDTRKIGAALPPPRGQAGTRLRSRQIGYRDITVRDVVVDASGG